MPWRESSSHHGISSRAFAESLRVKSHGRWYKPPPQSTRTDVGAYLKESHRELIRLRGAVAAPAVRSPAPPPTPRPARPPTPLAAVTFFQDLNVNIQGDHRLYNLCREIKLIQHQRTPYAAFMLLRTLLEAALEFHLRKKDLYDDFTSKKGDGRAILAALIDYCTRKHHKVFKDDGIREALTRLSTIKQHMDAVVHNRYSDITASALEMLKPYLRPVIEYIV